MDIKQLQYFIASVDTGSFCSAADALITTQPNVSKVVKSLENELNMTLLNRNRSGVTPTKEGELIYGYSMEVLKHMKMITNFRSEQYIETLSICSVPSNNISNIISKFYNSVSSTKEFKLDFMESNVEDMMKKRHRREAELGFIYISRKNIATFNRLIGNKGIKFYEMKRLPLYLSAGPKSPLYGKKTIEEKDLRNIKLIQYYEDQFSIYNHISYLKEDIFFNKEKSNISYTNSSQIIMQLLKNTDYCTIGSGILGNEEERKDISAIRILSSENTVSFGYIKRSKDALLPIAEEFLSYLKEHM